MILFLNKKDLFEEKLKRVRLSTCFPQYKCAVSGQLHILVTLYRFSQERLQEHDHVHIEEVREADRGSGEEHLRSPHVC